MTAGGCPCVLILGGGFAGVGAAEQLGKADAEIVLVDKHDYHTFQPLLYQVATGLLDSRRSDPIRDLFDKQADLRRRRLTRLIGHVADIVPGPHCRNAHRLALEPLVDVPFRQPG